MPKPFSWSWSKLKNFRTCPKRHYHVELAKDFKEEEGEALKWGHEVHDALAKYIEKAKPLPPTMQRHVGLVDELAHLHRAGKLVKVENKLAIDSDFRPVGFFDNSAWYRGVADVLFVNEERAGALDWKTGQIKPEYEQLALTAALIFAHYPQVTTVSTAFVWIGNDDYTVNTYGKESMTQMWNHLWPEINVMKEAYRTTTYPPKPSGICVRHCPVISCPYHGKGTR